jgi:hypothetical protein
MEGSVRAAERAYDLAISQAWHTEAFARMKGSDFKHALKRALNRKPRSAAADALAFFHGLRAKGVPVKIYKTPRPN